MAKTKAKESKSEAEIFKENFLKVKGNFVLEPNECSVALKRAYIGYKSDSFEDYNARLERRVIEKEGNLLPLKYTDFKDFWNSFSWSKVSGCLSAQKDMLSKYDVLKEFLKGEPFLVRNNKIHIKTSESFIRPDVEYLKSVFCSLLKNWMKIPTDLTGDYRDVTVNIIWESLRVENLKPGNVPGRYSFDFSFDYRARLSYVFNQEWDKNLYAIPKKICNLDRSKFLWDVIHFGENMVKGVPGDDSLICLKPCTWEDYIDRIELFALNKKDDFLSFLNLADEFLENGKHKKELSYLEKCRKDSYLYAKITTAQFSGHVRTVRPKNLDVEVEALSNLLEGMKVVKMLVEKFAEKTHQSSYQEISLKKGLGFVIAEKLMIDAVLYADDERPYIAELARAIISENLDVSEFPKM